MTFEQWLHEWIQNKLALTFSTTKAPETIKVEQSNVSDENKYTQTTSIVFTISFTQKKLAAENTQKIINQISKLSEESFIIKSEIAGSTIIDDALPKEWVYVLAVDIKHRKRDSWSVN